MRNGLVSTWVVMMVVACDPAPPVRMVHVLPDDFTTGFPILGGGRGVVDFDVLALRFPTAYPDAGVPRVEDIGARPLRVVSLARAAEVPGTLRAGYWNVEGEQVIDGSGWYDGAGVSFVPDEQLEDGWYVLVADLRALDATLEPVLGGGYLEGRFAYGRVHVGSRPTWHATVLQVDRGETEIAPLAVEWPSGAALAGTTFTVTADGAPVTCGPGTFPGISLRCPMRPVGTVWEVRMVSDVMMTPEGAHEGVTTIVQTEGSARGGGLDRSWISERFGVDVARAALGITD